MLKQNEWYTDTYYKVWFEKTNKTFDLKHRGIWMKKKSTSLQIKLHKERALNR